MQMVYKWNIPSTKIHSVFVIWKKHKLLDLHLVQMHRMKAAFAVLVSILAAFIRMSLQSLIFVAP